jgi:hypothetical protein
MERRYLKERLPFPLKLKKNTKSSSFMGMILRLGIS